MTSTHPFRRWRRSRPFWGGLLVIVGGAEILLTVWAPLGVVLHVGMQGLAGYLVPVVLMLCGILLLVSPGQRLFYSILAALLAMASWLTSNLGGFVFGLILCLVGSALAFAWAPSRDQRPPAPKRPAPEPPPLTDVDGLLDSDSGNPGSFIPGRDSGSFVPGRDSDSVAPARHARTEDSAG
jgi:hypothetical protein